MKKRLALLHTVVFLADTFRKLIQDQMPGLENFHLVDEGIIHALMDEGGLAPSITRRIGTHARLAEESGADLILFTCSSTSPAVDTVRALVNIPIMKIDEPMALHAVELGERIGVVATAKTTIDPSTRLIESTAAAAGRKVRVVGRLESPAFAAKLAGDNAAHDRLVANAVRGLARECDVVVLAQASMAYLAEPLAQEVPVPVLASPELCIAALKERLA